MPQVKYVLLVGLPTPSPICMTCWSLFQSFTLGFMLCTQLSTNNVVDLLKN